MSENYGSHAHSMQNQAWKENTDRQTPNKAEMLLQRFQDSLDRLDSGTVQLKDKINLLNAEEIPQKETEKAAKNISVDFIQKLHDKLDNLETMNSRIQYCINKLNALI